MKTLITAILAFITVPMMAQLSEGYYRVQNNGSERYITITDDVITNVDINSSILDYSNITTWTGFDKVKSNPGSVIYIKPVGTKYDLAAQGISVYDIAGGRTYIDMTYCGTKDGVGVYTISASVKSGGISVTKTLYDGSSSREKDYVGDSGAATHQYWRVKPMNTTDNYIGITPTVETNDGWYGTIYASFPFKTVSEGMKVYYVDGVCDGEFRLQEITDDIKPAATPLIVKCSSSDAANNMILPVVGNGTAVSGNLLKGTYFDSSLRNHIRRVEYDASNMRVLGKDNQGNLIFTTAKSSDLTNSAYIPKNTCWLQIPGWLTGDLKLVSREAFTGIQSINTDATTKKGTYTLSGMRIEKSDNLRPGVYIQDGKLVVIK